MHCLPFIHQAGDLIREVDQITKAGLFLGEPMLSMPANRLFFFFFLNFSVAPRIIFSTTFPSNKIRLTSLQSPGFSLRSNITCTTIFLSG